MSTAPRGTDPQAPSLAASTDEVLDVILFPPHVQEDIFREYFQVLHDSSDGPTHSAVSRHGNSPPGLSAVPSQAISHTGVVYKDLGWSQGSVGYKNLYGCHWEKGREVMEPVHAAPEGRGRQKVLFAHGHRALLIPCSWMSELVLSSSSARGWSGFMTTLDLRPQGCSMCTDWELFS